jgi:hypothetical protein
MIKKLVRTGNSAAVVLDKASLEALGLQDGDPVHVEVVPGDTRPMASIAHPHPAIVIANPEHLTGEERLASHDGQQVFNSPRLKKGG